MINIKMLQKNGFDMDQINQIVKIEEEENIDISNILTSIPAFKIRIIRKELMEMDPMQISYILNGIEKKLDVSIYAYKNNSYKKMEIILNALENNIDVEKYLNLYPGNERIEDLSFIFNAIKEGINTEKFEDPVFNIEQKKQIKNGIKSKIDINIYADPKYNAEQMSVLYKAIRSKIDIKDMLDPNYSYEKMEIIRYCLEKGYNITNYIDTDFSIEQIEQIKMGLEDNLDVSIFANKKYSITKMKAIRKILKHNKEKEDKISVKIYLLDLEDKEIENIRNIMKNGTLDEKINIYKKYNLNYYDSVKYNREYEQIVI